MTFEKQLERLDRIVSELQRDDLPLDEAMHLFEEGVAALREASAQLAHVETRVQRLVERGDGSFELTDFESRS
jgi:exodeoxyribonuclease VII small subunit